MNLYVSDHSDVYSINKLGPAGMSDRDLLKILLGTNTKSKTIDKAIHFLDSRAMDKSEFSPRQRAVLSAIGELARRYYPSRKTRIGAPRDLYPMIAHHAGDQEKFIVAVLDGAHQIISVEVISAGIVNRTIVHPREVFAPAISAKATAIIVAHNHPSGALEPSPEDIEITRRLTESGELVGIPVLDHLVFSNEGYYSLCEHGLIAPFND